MYHSCLSLLTLCNYSVPPLFFPALYCIFTLLFPVYYPFFGCFLLSPPPHFSPLLTCSLVSSYILFSSQIWSKAGCTGSTLSCTCSVASTWMETTGRKYSSPQITWLIPLLSLFLRYCCCYILLFTHPLHSLILKVVDMLSFLSRSYGRFDLVFDRIRSTLGQLVLKVCT